jgi:hypothetical protein
MRRFISTALSLGFLVSLCTLPARADDKSDIAAIVQKSIQALNAGDQKSVVGLGAPGMQTVIDDFGIKYWASPNALGNWFGDFGGMLKARGVSDVVVAISPAKYVRIEAKRAWATYPATYDYKIKGTAYHESGVLIYALEKVPVGWRILAVAWGRTS